MDKLKSNI